MGGQGGGAPTIGENSGVSIVSVPLKEMFNNAH